MNTQRPGAGPFLTATWRNLIMLNYAVEPSVLAPYVPRGTVLDSFDGTTYFSLVGFLFDDTRVLGVSIPWHRTFEEVNLRFYVRRELPGDVRRGVVFIRELVPRLAIAATARWLYNEPYRSLRMRHRFGAPAENGMPSRVEYEFRVAGDWNSLHASPRGEGREAPIGSLEEFITEHYWGYTRQRDGGTVEYRVEHPRWKVWDADDVAAVGELGATYGDAMAKVISATPASAFIANGSMVSVHLPIRLPGVR
jgi:uncharacterized protein YqjF (DUF2071 family)